MRQRWRQCRRTGEFIPVSTGRDSAVAPATASIRGDFEPFVSPIDKTIVSGRKAYREHCARHGVIPAQEIPPEYYEKKARERARAFMGERTPEQVRRDRMEIHEIVNYLERNNG